MITNKNQPAVHQDFRIFKDSLSIAKGDGSGYDLCLPQTYKLAQLGQQTVPSFVSLDGENRRITVTTDQNTETGNYAMYLVVKLEDYGVEFKQDFQVIIDECEIQFLQITEPQVKTFQYDIQPQGMNTLIIPYPESLIQPEECAYHGVRYDVEVNGNSNTPGFIELVSNGI